MMLKSHKVVILSHYFRPSKTFKRFPVHDDDLTGRAYADVLLEPDRASSEQPNEVISDKLAKLWIGACATCRAKPASRLCVFRCRIHSIPRSFAGPFKSESGSTFRTTVLLENVWVPKSYVKKRRQL